MSTFVTAFALLAPLALLWIASASLATTTAATLIALITALILRRRGADASWSWGMAALMATAAGTIVTVPTLPARSLVGALTLGAGVWMAIGALAARPWTATASARDWRGMQADELFLTINRALSLGWAVVMAVMGLAIWRDWPPVVHAVPTALAGVASALLPGWWTRHALARRLREADPNPWPSPVPERIGKPGNDDADVLVVGAGIGGLTAAALLARAGARVIVLEQHDKPGGFCHHWDGFGIDGESNLRFRFDAGVHDISGVFEGGTVQSLLARLDLAQAIDWRRLDHGFIDPAGRWDVPRGWPAFVDALATTAGDQAPGVRGLLADVRMIHASMYATATERGGVPGMPASPAALMAYAREHPLATAWMDRPFDDLMTHHRLRGDIRRRLTALSGYVTHDARGLRVRDYVPLLGYFLHGGYYPAGGSGALAQALADSISLDGGTLRLRSEVGSLIVDETSGRTQGVRLRDGAALRAPAVVMNGDALNLARSLLPDLPVTRVLRDELTALRPATSMFMVHLGVRGEVPALPPIVHLEADGQMLEIVFPSLVDPSAAPPGYHTIELMSLVDPASAAGWFDEPSDPQATTQRRSTVYLDRKARQADAMIDALAGLIPDLRQRIVCRYEASPVTFRRFGFSTLGAVYGVQAPLRRLPRRSPLPGLVFGGATTEGPGVEAAMIGGAQAADALMPGLLGGS